MVPITKSNTYCGRILLCENCGKEINMSELAFEKDGALMNAIFIHDKCRGKERKFKDIWKQKIYKQSLPIDNSDDSQQKHVEYRTFII